MLKAQLFFVVAKNRGGLLPNPFTPLPDPTIDINLRFRFSTKESAAHAIVAIHNSDVNGHTVKCSWGKESGDPNNLSANSQVSQNLSRGHDMMR